MNRLNYNQLYYFYVVATEGSVKSACEKLHLTQPTISGQLKTFEESLGFKLFERKHRKLVLNEHGKLLLSKAEKIFHLGEELVSTLPKKGQKVRQGIRLGVVPSLSSSLVQDFTLKIWKDLSTSIEIETADLELLLELVNQDKIDCVLADAPYHKSRKTYKSINLGEQALIAVGTKKFTHLRKGFPESLTDAPFIAYSKKSTLRGELDFFFKTNNIRPDILGAIDDTTLLRLLTESGLGISILPKLVVKESLKDKKLVILGEMANVKSNIWIITSPLGSKKIAVRKMINDYLVRKR